MPVDFLTPEQETRYGRYAGDPTPEQLAQYFYLDDADRALIAERRGDVNKLGFLVQLCTVRFLGAFLADPTAVPAAVVAYLARQVGVTDPSCLAHYLDRLPTHREHAGEIQRRFHYRDFTDQPEHFRLVRWLAARAWVSAERPSVLFDLATARLVERKVLLPGVTVLARLVASVRDRVAERLWRTLAALPSAAQRERLEQLVVVPEGARTTPLDQLRHAPTRLSVPGLLHGLQRVDALRAVGVSSLDVSAIPPSRLKALARYAGATWSPTIARMPQDRRVATLLAFVRVYEAVAQDDAVDVFIQLFGERMTLVEHRGAQARLRTLGDLDAAALLLRDVCRLVRDGAVRDAELRATITDRIDAGDIDVAIASVTALTRPPEDHHYDDLLTRYSMVRQFLPRLLRTLRFGATGGGQPVLDALQFLREIEGQRRPELAEAPKALITKAWKPYVLEPGQRVSRRAYTFCTLERLRDGLRRRDIYVQPGERWGNAGANLLQGAAWEAARPQVCRSLGHAPDAGVALAQLGKGLDTAYRQTAANLPANRDVRIERADGKDRLVLTPLEKLDDPPSLQTLRLAVASRLPRIDLPDALLEIQARTGFAQEFTHLSEGNARVTDLPTSLCAILLAQACNVGMEAVVQPGVPALSQDRLLWVEQNYLRAETLVRANARLVAAQSRLPLARRWGGGEVASADGLRFRVPVRTINAGPNPKYFPGRGVTYFNFTSDQFSGMHGIVIPGTPKEGPYLLAGLLEQQTSLHPTEIMTDTGSYTDQLFGLFWLLGYQFSPRLADVGDARLWRMDRGADYGPLDGVARQHVNTALIAQHWDDLLRIAGSLKMGAVGAVPLVQLLQGAARNSASSKALTELGRVAKTSFLLPYFDDPAYRRRILVQLNRGEARHTLARAVYHGRKGELRQRYREGQEDQLAALGLVVNILVLWTTLYMDYVLAHLPSLGIEPKPEDIARLSPLGFRHINLHGHYHFALPEFITRGEFRPLREPDATDDGAPVST
jgi:TnpA family transposase